MTIQAEVKWVQDLQFVGRAGDGPAVVMDTPDGGSGASPMELLIMGTAGCTAVDVMTILQKQRAKVTGFKVIISGERAEEYPKRYTDIHVTYVIQGTDIKENSVEKAIELSERKYCGAMASLNATITHTHRIDP